MSLRVEVEKKLGTFSLQVSFEGEMGQVLGLLGASGSGKSMTLQCIAGLCTPDRGRIELDGRVLFDHAAGINLPPQRRQVGYLFQQYALFPHYTVEQNIAVAARQSQQVEELLRRFRLEPHRSKRPAQLSGGEQQRVALARILAAQPRMLLLDEPFSALDTHLRGEIQGELAQFLAQFSGPCVLVTHSRDEVRQLCQQVCVMHAGRSQPAQDTPEFFRWPRTLAAARLLGLTNLSPVEENGEGGWVASAWGVPVEAPPGTTHVALHPHHIRLAEEAGPDLAPGRCIRVQVGPFSVHADVAWAGGVLEVEVARDRWDQLADLQQIWLDLPRDQLIPLVEET